MNPQRHSNCADTPRYRKVLSLRCLTAILAVTLHVLAPQLVPGEILWSDLGTTTVNNSDVEVFSKIIRRDDRSSDILFFKVHISPLSDVSTEEYMAALQLFEGGEERLGIGNSLKAWAYSVFRTATSGEFNRVFGDVDLRTSRPELSSPGVFLPYELPRRGIENTIVVKVEYVPGGDDLITVWLSPDLSPGAAEEDQPEILRTQVQADASFDSIRLRHHGGGNGWSFRELAVATRFSDFVAGHGSESDSSLILAGQGEFPFLLRSWNRQDGLPNPSIRTVKQTRDGYIWLGTDEGISRFDGVRFVQFGLREGFGRERVRVLYEDSRTNLWIGTEGDGIKCLKDGKLSAFTRTNGLPGDSIRDVCETATGELYIATDKGLTIWEVTKSRFSSQGVYFQDNDVTDVAVADSGGVWVTVAGRGVFQVVNAGIEQLEDSVFSDLLAGARCVLEDKAGRLWIGAGDDSLLCRDRDSGQWHQHRLPRHQARPYVTKLVQSADGSVWAGSSSEGLLRFEGGKMLLVSSSSGLSDNSIQAIEFDREGNVWVGTAAGLNRMSRRQLMLFGPKEGLGFGGVLGLAEVAPGVIWAAKADGELYGWHRRKFAPLKPDGNALLHGRVLLKTTTGDCWIGGANGVFRVVPGSEGVKVVSHSLTSVSVTSLAEEKTGKIWAGTGSGELWSFTNGTWLTHSNWFQKEAVTCLSPGPDGLLVGTAGAGLVRLSPGATKVWNRTNGLLSDSIRCIHRDEDRIWVGTMGGGLSLIQGEDISTFTTREGLPDNTISQITDDGLGNIWLGTSRGIARLNQQELVQWNWASERKLYPRVFGRDAGAQTEETTGGFSPVGLRSSAGLIWFPTARGLVAIEPKRRLASGAPPAVIVESVLMDNKQVPLPRASVTGLTPTLKLAPGRRSLEFQFTGISFEYPELLRFRHRLQGLEPDWVDAGARRTALYNYVPPGEYKFSVMACDADGQWNETGAHIAVVIPPHFWQSRWFIAMGALLALVLVGGVARLAGNRRLNRQLQFLEQQRALEKERARIAQDLHDDLGSSLTRISLLADLVKADKDHPEQVEMHTTRLVQSASQTVRSLEEIVWALRPTSDSLQSLADYIAHFADELFEGSSIRCRLDLPHDLPAQSLSLETRHNLFLIVKEGLTNALKHSHAREVRVQAKAADGKLQISIQDDGVGFSEPQQEKPGRNNGLGNMRSRAASIRGNLEVTSAPGKGTLVRVQVPLAPKKDSEAGLPSARTESQ